MTVDNWVRYAQDGEPSAVEALYEHFVERIYRYVFYRVYNQRDAEDLTAEVFVKMVEGLPQYRFTGAPFEAWLYRIANSRVVDYHRRLRRRPESELSEHMADTVTHLEENVQQLLEVERLRHALRQLGNEEQSVLIMRFVEQKSHHEVADIMSKTPAAVKAMQHRALIRLATLLGSDEKVRHYLRGGSHEPNASRS